MALCPGRFNVPLADNEGQPIDPFEVAVVNADRRKELVAEAKEIARRVDSWVSLSNALSDPVGGLIARYFPDARQREEFLRSPEYEELNQLLLRMIKRKGLYPRPAAGSNGADH